MRACLSGPSGEEPPNEPGSIDAARARLPWRASSVATNFTCPMHDVASRQGQCAQEPSAPCSALSVILGLEKIVYVPTGC